MTNAYNTVQRAADYGGYVTPGINWTTVTFENEEWAYAFYRTCLGNNIDTRQPWRRGDITSVSIRH